MAESTTLASRLKDDEAAALDGMNERLAAFDSEFVARQTRHQEHVRAVEAHSTEVVESLSELETRLVGISATAETAGLNLSLGAENLAGRISESRAALAGAEQEIAALTDSSVRLLELIQAGSQHSREHLPVALGAAEQQLANVEARIKAMHDSAREVAEIGERVQGTIRESQQEIATSASSLEALHVHLGEQAVVHGTALDSLHHSLDAIQAKSASLASTLEAELKTAIEKLVLDRSEAISAPIEQASQRAAELTRENAASPGRESRPRKRSRTISYGGSR